VLGVAQEGEGEVEFCGKRPVLLDAVEGDAEDRDVLLLEFADSITESAPLESSARRVCFGVEPEQEALAVEVAQTHAPAVVVCHVELGSLSADR
jgi:hypothetical protein